MKQELDLGFVPMNFSHGVEISSVEYANDNECDNKCNCYTRPYPDDKY